MPLPPVLSNTDSSAHLLPTGIFASTSSHKCTLLLHTSRRQKHSPAALDVVDAATGELAFRVAVRASGLRDQLGPFLVFSPRHDAVANEVRAVISDADGKELLALEQLQGAIGTAFVGHDPSSGLGLCAVKVSGYFEKTLSLYVLSNLSG
jgi:hypothetical protein